MADLLPSIPDLSDAGGDDPRVVGIDSDDADELISALSSGTARQILATLHEQPSTPAAIADRVDTSLQNVQYHLDSLEDAGVVEVADTAYSSKGREMSVYAPTDRALVVVASPDEETEGLKAALSRLLGGVGVLALASVAVERIARTPRPDALAERGGGGAGADGGGATSTPEPTATESVAVEVEDAAETATATAEPATTAAEATRTAVEAGGADSVAGLAASPGLLFFLGGLTVLLAWVALTIYR